MNRALKTLLLWLLIAVLPIQGWAAAMQTACSAAHKAKSAKRAGVTADHHAGAPHAHHHETASQHVLPAGDTTLERDVSSSAHAEQKTSFKSAFCSACALCCYGAIAPPSAIILAAVLDSGAIRFSAAAPLPALHFRSGLERPPRLTLA